MPALTPRGYPYSIPTDPADIPQAIEDLATAIDLDVQARYDSIHPRAVFRLSSTSIVAFGQPVVTSTTNKTLPFELEDVNIGGGIQPLQGSTTRIVPQLPGFWWLHGAMVVPRAGATSRDLIGISIQDQSQILARNSTHLAPPASDGANLLTVSTGAFFNGTTDYIELVASVGGTPTPGVGNLNIRSRYLVGMRMTET